MAVEYSYDYWFFILVAVGLMVIIGLVQPRTRAWTGRLLLGGVVLIALLVIGLRSYRQVGGVAEKRIAYQDDYDSIAKTRNRQTAEREATAQKSSSRLDVVEATVAQESTSQVVEDAKQGHEHVDHETHAETAPAESASATSKPLKNKSKDGRPDWVGKPPYQEGDTYVWPVVSESRLVGQDTEASLRKNAEAAVKEFLEVRLLRDEEAVQYLSHNNELRKLMLKKILAPDRYQESMIKPSSGPFIPEDEWEANSELWQHRYSIQAGPWYRRHGVLRFTPEVTGEIEQRWQQHLAQTVSQREAVTRVIHQSDQTLALMARVVIVLLLMLLVGGLIFSRHARTSMAKLLPFGAIFAVIGGYWMLVAVPKMENQRRSAAVAKLESVGRAFQGNAKASASEAPTNDTIPVGEVTTAAEPVAEGSATDAEPKWLHDQPQKRGDAYFIVVRSKVSDPKYRDEALDLKMEAAAKQYVGDVLGQPGASDTMEVTANYLHERCVAQRHDATDSSETYVQLKFDQRFLNEIRNRYKQQVSKGRVEQLGGVTLGVLGVLAVALAFLRFTKPRDDSVKRGD